MSTTGKIRLPAVQERQEEEEFYSVSWGDFSPLKTLHLGLRSSALMVFKKEGSLPYILQSCPEDEWTGYRAQLLEEARKSEDFVLPRFMFLHQNRVYVGSEILEPDPGMSLADLIGSTIPMTELHASAVLKQVSSDNI
jgi:hypothetical protein